MRSANEHEQQNDGFLKFRSSLNSDTDLSVKRKPTFGSSLFLTKSLYTLCRKRDSICSLQTVFNHRNLVCNYSWTFLMFSGCFEQRYACFNVISRRLEDFMFIVGYKYEPLLMERFSMHCCFIPVISTSKHNLAVERMKTNQFVFVL